MELTDNMKGDIALFIGTWLYYHERGEKMPMPPFFAQDKTLRRGFNKTLKIVEKLYEEHGTDYLKQVVAEAMAKGWLKI